MQFVSGGWRFGRDGLVTVHFGVRVAAAIIANVVVAAAGADADDRGGGGGIFIIYIEIVLIGGDAEVVHGTPGARCRQRFQIGNRRRQRVFVVRIVSIPAGRRGL